MEIEFGTDGARGPYQSPEVGYHVGRAAAEALGLSHFVLVQDTRPFNPELADALKQGLAASGAEVLDLGVLPTPAGAITASALTRERNVPHGAISLSASHNPAPDFGIKVFGTDGTKLDDKTTRHLEQIANEDRPVSLRNWAGLNESQDETDFYRQEYIDYLSSTRWSGLDKDFLSGTRIILDAANGAAHWSAQTALRELGAEVSVINANPSGEINKNSGATHPEVITSIAKQIKAVGFSFDGDADRLFTSTAKGRELDGDHSIHIVMMAMDLLGKLSTRKYVSTKYSNFGLRHSLSQHKITAIEVTNGDREVAQVMGSTIPVGGERSGHTLFNDVASRTNLTMTGDGTVTAIQLLSAIAQTEKTLEELAIPKLLPHLELKVKDLQGNIFDSERYRRVKSEVDAAQDGEGDNLGRLSGTEKGVGRLLVRDIDADRAAWAMGTLEAAIRS
jgi:phosphoglucosamine mutase